MAFSYAIFTHSISKSKELISILLQTKVFVELYYHIDLHTVNNFDVCRQNWLLYLSIYVVFS